MEVWQGGLIRGDSGEASLERSAEEAECPMVMIVGGVTEDATSAVTETLPCWSCARCVFASTTTCLRKGLRFTSLVVDVYQ